jgi:hypothetical protein
MKMESYIFTKIFTNVMKFWTKLFRRFCLPRKWREDRSCIETLMIEVINNSAIEESNVLQSTARGLTSSAPA